MGDNGYALDLLSPVCHVATEMDRAAGAALSIEVMAATYQHPNTGDLARVRAQENCASDDDAVRWLIGRAVEAIARRGKSGKEQVKQGADGYRLIVPFDELRYDSKKLARARNDHAQLRDPFNPMSGRWSENVRRNTGKDSMNELRESMREFGWVEEFPAIKDERGVVLVGHRRLAVAAELGIEPAVKTVRLGDGDEADAKRFRIEIVSNLAAKPFTPEERKDLAEYLYGEREWSMAKIAQALNVHVMTVSRDLVGVSHDVKPSRGGRPRNITAEQKQQVIEGYFEQGKTMAEVAKDVLGDHLKKSETPSGIIKIIDQERGRREQKAAAKPVRQVAEHACPHCGAMHPVT